MNMDVTKRSDRCLGFFRFSVIQFLEAFERLHVLKGFDQGFDQVSHNMCRKKNDGFVLFHQGVCVCGIMTMMMMHSNVLMCIRKNLISQSP